MERHGSKEPDTKMKTDRCNPRRVRLVILVCQLGLILMTEAQTPERCIRHYTYRPPENTDITVMCGTEYMDLSIYLCPVYQALYNESLMVLNKQFNKAECFGTADWAVDPPVLKFRFSSLGSFSSFCNNKFEIINQGGSGHFSHFSQVQFVNISGIVTSVDPSAGMITYRPQILYKFSCLYPMQYLLNNTKLGVSGVSLAINDNNGSFISTLSMHLYKDEGFQEMLIIPQTGLSPKTKIYVAVKATNLTDRFNVLLDRCYATTSPYPTMSTYYDLFIGCNRDAKTKVEVNGESQEALFYFEAFRFVEHTNQTISTFYLHCVTRLCEVSSCHRLLPVCSSVRRQSKREAQYVSNSTTITSPVILVGEQNTGGTHGQRTTTDIPSYYQTDREDKYGTHQQPLSVFEATSSLSGYTIPTVALIVCNLILNICFFV